MGFIRKHRFALTIEFNIYNIIKKRQPYFNKIGVSNFIIKLVAYFFLSSSLKN
jgi:hypothetical protein